MYLKFVLFVGGIAGVLFLYLWLDVPVESENFSMRRDSHDENKIIFEWTGTIDPPMARLLRLEFKKIKNDYSKIELDFHSPGGSTIEGAQVIKVINNMKRSHEVTTFVGHNNQCASMCIPIYMAGEVRSAAPSSIWYFHEPFSVNPVTQKQTLMFDSERYQATLLFYNKYFEDSVMSPDWYEYLKKSIAPGSKAELEKTGRQLKRENSNIVTVLVTL